METERDGWIFKRPEDVLQFAHDADPNFHELDSRVIMAIFNASACDYNESYGWEDRALVDFYDALLAAWQAL